MESGPMTSVFLEGILPKLECQNQIRGFILARQPPKSENYWTINFRFYIALITNSRKIGPTTSENNSEFWPVDLRYSWPEILRNDWPVEVRFRQ